MHRITLPRIRHIAPLMASPALSAFGILNWSRIQLTEHFAPSG
jgi:hypothetical protein